MALRWGRWGSARRQVDRSYPVLLQNTSRCQTLAHLKLGTEACIGDGIEDAGVDVVVAVEPAAIAVVVIVPKRSESQEYLPEHPLRLIWCIGRLMDESGCPVKFRLERLEPGATYPNPMRTLAP